MNWITKGEAIRVAGKEASEADVSEAYQLIREVRDAAGEILTKEEVLQSAEDIMEERRKSRGQREMDIDLHEPFSTTWLNEMRAQTGHWEDAR